MRVWMQNLIKNEFRKEPAEFRVAKRLLRTSLTVEQVHEMMLEINIPDVWRIKVLNAMRDLSRE